MIESRKKSELTKLWVYTALQTIKENGSQMRSKELFSLLESKLDLDDWAKRKYEKSGGVRWRIIIGFWSNGSVKAGFLIKKDGIWYLTEEGQKALSLGKDKWWELQDQAYKKFIEQKKQNSNSLEMISDESLEDEEIADNIFNLEELESRAEESLINYLTTKNPYEFQDIVGALLRGMGYYTPFVAPKGKDGGVDIIAYKDPLGTISPRIKVQVKHKQTTASTGPEISELIGVLQKDGDIGIFVSTGGFTSDAKQRARNAHIHIELIDLIRFLSLWKEFYTNLKDEDKAKLPMKKVYCLFPDED